ncbi:conserved unknown protein [Ectocarpus siliculosus]|uniref:non-specific serine/threonine protein kinase n=1 Tax=Ectocarpus siliculosus TaxID=2880 RepID=D7FUQ7_ECTSI|nr:conserved unknown protein [Ectocarpus siliculosus]|eukprot:CBJ31713.1 conserved unknown protein [Ectocarpus siliculosus]
MEQQFDVLQTLGRGSFGVVRKVRRKADGKTLVVKEMDYGAADEKQKEQIVAEVNILRELRHPFIVRYYDRIVDRRRTRLHIVMEHCSTDLARVIKTRRLRGEYLDESFLWNLMCQVVVALEFCHGRMGKEGSRRPIIHRDLKPDNVFLTSDNVVKLGDFGLAKELSGAQLAETSVGTPYYMSPELINEQRYDERTDVWSLGCLMYEAAALTRPFDAHNQLALAMKINTSKVAPIPSRYSPDLFATIEWMLSKTRHKRPRMEDLAKVPGLQLPLRENRLLVQEFQLEQSYLRRLRTLKSREVDIERREAELATGEAKLRYRSERALAALNSQRESRKEQEQEGDKRTVAGGGGHPGCCFCFPRGSSLPAAGVGAANGHEAREAVAERGAAAGEQRKTPRRERECRGVAGEDVTMLLRRRRRGADADADAEGSAAPGSGGSDSSRRGEEIAKPECYASPTSGDKSDLRTPNAADATTAVLDYASLVLHRETSRHVSPIAHRSSSGSTDADSGERVVAREQAESAVSRERASECGGGGGRGDPKSTVKTADDDDDDDDDAVGTTAVVSPPRSSSCLDETVPMGSHEGGTFAAPPCVLAAGAAPPPPPRRQQPRNRYRYNRHDDDEDRASSPAGEGRRRRARGGWDDNGGELRSTRTEAVMAAGRKARESYAGFMETIAAARDLGTWAAPVPPPPPPPPPPQQRRDHGVNNKHNKENAYASSPGAAAAAATAAAEYSQNTPLAELPNGRAAGAPHISSLMAWVSARARPAGEGGVTGGALAAKSLRRREFMGAAAPLSRHRRLPGKGRPPCRRLRGPELAPQSPLAEACGDRG